MKPMTAPAMAPPLRAFEGRSGRGSRYAVEQEHVMVSCYVARYSIPVKSLIVCKLGLSRIIIICHLK